MDSEENKMKTSDTTRSDAAEHHQYDAETPLPLGLVDVEFARKLETELNTAIVNEAFAENKVYMLEKQLKQANERIKRLEEMYEGEIGENEQFLGSNLKGLLIREINECNKIIRQQQLLDEENLMLKNRIKQLDDWKQSALEVEREWDANAVATMLGAKLGESQRKVIQREVPLLFERIKRLEDAGDVLFENSYPSMWDLPAAADQKLTDQSNWLKAKEAKP